jgi:hypothetical protein
MTMVRLLDARFGSMAEIRPAVPGLLRICAHLPERAQPEDITDLRVLLVADLLTRTAQVSNLQALVSLESSEQSAVHAETLTRLVTALGIHPPAAQARCGDARAALGGPIDVHLVGGGADADIADGLCVNIGAARLDATDNLDATDDGAGDADQGEVSGWRQYEPLAIRLALMSSPYHQPAEIGHDMLADSAGTLDEWRLLVARWAELPSKPVPAHLAEAARAAFRDLDTVSALSQLRTLVPDAGTPDGAKFETFVYIDRVLGLEFARRIGRL